MAVVLLTGSWLLLTCLKAPLIVAHRGASSDAPENTIAAFNLAWRQNADAIEGDFHLTKDGRIVCIHDYTTMRTAGVDLPVGRSTLRQLRQLDIGSWKGKKWTGEKIPTIEEVLATVPDGRKVYVHIKCGAEIIPPLNEALRGSGVKPAQIVILTTDKTVVAAAKKQLSGTPVVWLADLNCDSRPKQRSAYLRQLIETLKAIRADGLSINAHTDIDNGFVDALRRNNIKMHAWNVDNPVTTAHLWHLGADSLTTDHPGWFRLLLRSTGGRVPSSPPVVVAALSTAR
jgi:glycerophosphoryl diester phosphodiesterase